MAAHCRCKAITCLYLPIIVSWKASLSAALKAVAYVAPTMTVCNSFCLQHPCLIIFGITVLIPISQNRGFQTPQSNEGSKTRLIDESIAY